MQEELETLKESLRFEKQNLAEATQSLERLRSQYDEKDNEHQVSTAISLHQTYFEPLFLFIWSILFSDHVNRKKGFGSKNCKIEHYDVGK